jgi:hypothetical protein
LRVVSDFLLEFTLGPDRLPFQIGTDDHWRPMFMTSSAPLLGGFLEPVNLWIEREGARPEFSVTDLLNHLNELQRSVVQNFGAGFGRGYAMPAPAAVPAAGAPNGDKTTVDFAAALERMLQSQAKKAKSSENAVGEEGEGGNEWEDNSPRSIGSDEEEMQREADAGVAAAPAAAPPAPPVQRVAATAELFEAEIIPALRAFLEGEHFQAYEVDEWTRRVQSVVQQGRLDEALRLVREEALNGAPLPAVLEKYYAPDAPLMEQLERMHRQRNRVYYTRDGLSEEAAEHLQAEAESLRETNATRVLGFIAAPCGNALGHWDVTLLGESFDPSSPLGMQLIEWTMNHGRGDGLAGSNSNVVRPADVQIEMLMPQDFPARGPTFRLIAPRFRDVHRLNLCLSRSASPAGDDERTAMTVSRDFDTAWDPSQSLNDIVASVRARLEDAEVDLEAGKDASLATVGGFWRTYVCVSPAAVGKPEMEHSGQITLPSSALEQLFNQNQQPYGNGGFGGRGRLRMFGSAGLQQSGGPMTFEISTSGGRRSFCGVGEFTAEEGSCVVPAWMAKNLELQVGEELHVRRVYVPKGIYMKLQPHDARYAKVGDTKRMLEWVLSRYTAVASGDTLVVNYRGQDFSFNILEVSPGKAIRLIDSDVAVDFAPPLSGEEVPKQMMEAEGDHDNNNHHDAPVATAAPPAAAVAAAPTGQALGGHTLSGTEGVDWKKCPNCRRGIPIATFDRHTLQCARLQWFCELCQTAIEKRSQAEHMESLHAMLFCDCGTELEARAMAAHRQNDCVLRDRNCSYCQLRMPHAELLVHEQQCGSKTEKCDQCGLYIKVRDLVGHGAVCGIADVAVPPRRFSGGRDNDWGAGGGGGRRDDLFSCPHCQEPFVAIDDLEVHILVTHGELQEGAAPMAVSPPVSPKPAAAAAPRTPPPVETPFVFEPPSDDVIQFEKK